MERGNQVVGTISPIAGAPAGAFAVTTGAARLGMSREQAAIGAAVVGFATAANTSGWARGMALGVGAAGVAVAVAHHVGREAKNEAQRLATREDLKAALRRFVESRAKAEPTPSATARNEARTLKAEPTATTPDVLQRFNAVVEQLSDDEREQLSAFIDHAPEDTLRTAQAFLLDTSTDESVRFIREHLLIGRPS